MEKTGTGKRTTGIRTDGNNLSFLSRTLEELTDFSPDADICSYVATTLKELLGPDVVILVSSFDPESRNVVIRSFKGLDQWLPEIERLLGRPLTGLSFTIPQDADIRLRTGECDELPGQLSALTFGEIPERICHPIESLPFFGNVYCTGISWKGVLHGSVTFILRPGEDLQNRNLISLFIRQVAGYLRRQQAELDVRDQYANLHGIINSSESPIFSIDRDYRYTSFNRSHAAVMKAIYGADIAIGHSLLDYITVEEVRINARKNLDRALAGEQFTDQEYSGDGACKRIFFEISHNPIRNSRGTVTGVAVYARDITERRRIELALQESEATARALINATTESALLIDKDGVIIAANTITAKRLGHTVDEILGKNAYDFFPTDLAASRKRHVMKVLESGNPVQFEDIRFGRIIENNVFPVTDEDGKIFRFALFGRDITDERNARAQLQKNEQFLSDVLGSIQQGISVLDKDLRIIRVNPILETWHTHAMPLIGKKCYEAYHTKTGPCKTCPVRETFATGKAALRTIPKSGIGGIDTGWLDLYSFPLIDSTTGEMTGVIEYVQDITDRRNAEDALRRSEEQLKLALQASNFGIWTWDIATNERHIYTGGGLLFGYTEPELEEYFRNIEARAHPLDRGPSGSIPTMIRQSASGETVEFELRIRDKEGAWKTMLIRGSVVRRDPEGRPLLMMGVFRDITERKKMEEALRESEEKYRQLYDSMIDAFACVDMHGRLTLFNESFRQMVGYEPAEITTLTYQDLTPEKWHAKEAEIIENQVLRRGYSDIFEKEYRRKDGTVFPVELRTFLMKDTTGNNKGMWAIVRDITERNRAEATLKSREELLRLFTEHAPAALAMLDTDLRYIAVSHRWRADYHLGDRDLIGHSHLEIFPELPEEIIAVLRRGLAGEVSSSKEDRFVRQDGAVQWLAWEVRPWYTSGRNIGGVIVFSEDITARKLAEEALRQSEEKYRAIVENNQNMVYRADLNGIFTMVNPAGAQLVGLASPSQLVGRPVTDYYMNPDDRSAIIEALKKNGSVENYPVVLKAADGTVRHVLASSHFFYDPEGAVQGVEGIIHDVTELRLTEQALHTAQEKYLKAFQEAPDGITISDLDSGEFLEVNDAVTKILGYSRDELIGHTAVDLGIWPSREKREEFISLLRKEGRVEQFEVVERRKSGEFFHCQVNADTILIGNRKCFLAVVRDVTEQKNAQDALKKAHDELEVRVQERTKALRESEERLRLKLESVLSPDTDISELELANILDIPEIQSLMEDFTRLTGMTTSVLDMKGNIIEATGWQDICTKFHRKHERTAKFCTESDLFLAENLTPGQYVMYKCKNGLWDVATPIYFGTKHAGNIYTGQFFFTDEPVDKTAFLARAEKFGFDKNEYMAALSRVPRFSREQVTVLMDYLVRFTLLISRISFSNLQLAQAKNRLEMTAEDLRNLSEDLDRRVIERTAELSQAQDAYRRANEKLNLLSSITRHDIKNQLLALSGFLEISKKSLSDPATLAKFIAKEERIAETIAHQISFTKDYEDLGVKAPVWQNVDEVIRRAVTRLPLGKVRVITGDTALEIFADPLLEKVFYNLTDNALRYGGEKITCIRVSQRINNGDLILVFEDDGEGIQYGDKARLFTKGFGKNTGLGLYLSREILSITDITITENGEPGKGARFEMTIPHGMYRGMNEGN